MGGGIVGLITAICPARNMNSYIPTRATQLLNTWYHVSILIAEDTNMKIRETQYATTKTTRSSQLRSAQRRTSATGIRTSVYVHCT